MSTNHTPRLYSSRLRVLSTYFVTLIPDFKAGTYRTLHCLHSFSKDSQGCLLSTSYSYTFTPTSTRLVPVIPLIRIGYMATTHLWTLMLQEKSSTLTLSRHAFNFCFLSIHFQYPNVAAVRGAAKAKKIHSWEVATVNPLAKFVPKNCMPNRVCECQSSKLRYPWKNSQRRR